MPPGVGQAIRRGPPKNPASMGTLEKGDVRAVRSAGDGAGTCVHVLGGLRPPTPPWVAESLGRSAGCAGLGSLFFSQQRSQRNPIRVTGGAVRIVHIAAAL